MLPPNPPRPFSLVDALFLVAAIAVGLALDRSLSLLEHVYTNTAVMGHEGYGALSSGRGDGEPRYFSHPPGPWAPGSSWQYLPVYVHLVSYRLTPILFAWTVGVAGLSFRGPRAPLRELARRPEVVTGAAVVASLLVSAAQYPRMLIEQPGFILHGWHWWWATWSSVVRAAGFAVAMAWLPLAARGSSSEGRGWLARLGRVVAACWVGVGLLDVLASWLGAVIR